MFERFFQRSIEMCRKAGLLSEEPVYVDTTLVQAAASMDSLVQKEEVIKPPLSIRDYVQRTTPLLRERKTYSYLLLNRPLPIPGCHPVIARCDWMDIVARLIMS